MPRAALFDLDRTLLDCNSGRLWMQHELRSGNIRLRDAVWASWWLTRYSLGFETGLDDVFAAAVRGLEGQSESELDRRTRAWFECHVRQRLRPGAAACLEEHRTAGDLLVLATSSSAYAAAAAAESFGLAQRISTLFEVVDGHFTGAISSPALGHHKAARVREWAASGSIDLSKAVFYTDSMTDLALLEAVGEPVAVNPDRALRREARRRGWRVEDWGRAH